ncbi:MAG: type I-C CRISPR-associated protein Cas5c, partial [Lachnospiraceae bacterium]
ERVSYDVLTPSAARGLVEAIYWKPAIKWVIDKISVCNPIVFTNIRRNEVKSKILASSVKSVMNGKKADLFIDTTADRQQRAAMVLTNVRYVIEAHFELTDKAGESDTKEKHYNIILRRIRKGQCYHTPCFGCREFTAHFKEADENQCSQPISETRDLGFMLYDMDFSDPENITPIFFRAKMEHGIIDTRNIEMVR